MTMNIRHLRPGDSGHPTFLAELALEPLRSEWWMDAESEVDERVSYLVAFDGSTAAAWAGYLVVGELLRCCDNYVRRGYYDRGLYEAAYAARHRLVVTQLSLPAETYLFPEPVALHEADGWVRDTSPGGLGTSRVTGRVHIWQRLTWAPPRY